MARKKVLILQNQILNYRIPVYEKLQKEYDVTVIHIGKKVSRDFNEIILNPYRIGPFYFLKNFRKSIYNLLSKKLNYFQEIYVDCNFSSTSLLSFDLSIKSSSIMDNTC